KRDGVAPKRRRLSLDLFLFLFLSENKEGTSVRCRSGSLRAAVGQRGSSSPRALCASRRRLAEYSRRMCDETDLHRSRVCGIGGTAGFGTIGGGRGGGRQGKQQRLGREQDGHSSERQD